MLRQYSPQRFRYQTIMGKTVEIGTVPVGEIVFIDGAKHIVECWHTREIGAGRDVNGKWQNVYTPRGGHLATVRRLKDGRKKKIADHFLVDT